MLRLGFEVRVEVLLNGSAEGDRIWVQVTRDDSERLQLKPGDVIHLRPARPRTVAAVTSG